MTTTPPLTPEERLARLEGVYDHLATQAHIGEVKAEIGEAKAEMQARIGEVKAEIGEVKVEIARVEGDLKAENCQPQRQSSNFAYRNICWFSSTQYHFAVLAFVISSMRSVAETGSPFLGCPLLLRCFNKVARLIIQPRRGTRARMIAFRAGGCIGSRRC